MQELIASLEALEDKIGKILLKKAIPGSEPVHGNFPSQISPDLLYILAKNGITSLYSHQSEAIQKALKGEHIVCATPTASGKTLIYTVPVLQKCIEDKEAKALYLFPLKALQQDQLRQLTNFTSLFPSGCEPKAQVLDGDTPQYIRRQIKSSPPNIILTNPDMLHMSILPYHGSYAAFLKGLRFIVIDEVHTYRGVFGSHMAWVLRRLQRILRFYGADPVFIMSSATIGNPKEHAETLIGSEVHAITKTGAPMGKRSLVFMDPLESPTVTATLIFEMAVKRGLRTICYTQSRKLTELIGIWLNERGRGLKDKVAVYRAGLLADERRMVEKRLQSGELLGVVSTSALELGIDIGDLDCSILLGYPGSIMAAWQRWGRAGRKLQDSLLILIAQEDSLDKYVIRHPQVILESPPESAVLNPKNPAIMEKHIECACSELPVYTNESILRDPEIIAQVEKMTEEGTIFLSEDGKRLFTPARYPQKDVDLRGSGKRLSIVLEDTGEVIGDIDLFRAMKEAHPGAIYLHGARQFEVKELDLQQSVVLITPFKGNHFTRALVEKETEILEERAQKRLWGTSIHFGSIKVTERVTGYELRSVKGQILMGRRGLNLPPMTFETEGVWLEIDQSIREKVERNYMHFMGGIHALEHALIGILPVIVLADRNDIGGISQPFHPQVGDAAVFIYDGVSGGIGLSFAAYKKGEELLKRGLQAIEGCSCERGCPACVHSPKCGSGNRPMDKAAAISILRQIIFGQKMGNSVKTEIVRSEMRRKIKQKETKTIKPIDEIRFGVLDVETQLSAQEVGGWHNAELMRISCAVIYDSREDEYRSFLEPEIEELEEYLKQFQLIVGFNIRRFDYKVLSHYIQRDLLYSLPTLDILEEVHRRLGYRLSLDHLANCTLGTKKSGNGLLALKWWRQGKVQRIIDYCTDDVRITKELFVHGVQKGYLLFKNKAGSLVRLNVTFRLPGPQGQPLG